MGWCSHGQKFEFKVFLFKRSVSNHIYIIHYNTINRYVCTWLYMHVSCIINVQKTRQSNNMLLKQWHVSALLKSWSFQKQLLLSWWGDRVFQVLRFSHDPNTLPKINIEPENWWFPSSESPVFQGEPPPFSGFMFLFGGPKNHVFFPPLVVPGHSFEASWSALDLQFPAASTKGLDQPAMECLPAFSCLGSWNMKNDGWYAWYVIIIRLYILNIYIWKIYGIVINKSYDYWWWISMGMDNARWWWITMKDGARVFMVSPSSWKIIFHCPRP